MLTLCFCFLSAVPIAQGAEPIVISMTADRWQAKENAEFFKEAGFYRGLMRVNSGTASLNPGTVGWLQAPLAMTTARQRISPRVVVT